MAINIMLSGIKMVAQDWLFAYYPREKDVYLSKFYLIKEQRGKVLPRIFCNLLLERQRNMVFLLLF